MIRFAFEAGRGVGKTLPPECPKGIAERVCRVLKKTERGEKRL